MVGRESPRAAWQDENTLRVKCPKCLRAHDFGVVNDFQMWQIGDDPGDIFEASRDPGGAISLYPDFVCLNSACNYTGTIRFHR